MFTNDDISRYYDLSEVHYRKIWDLDHCRSLHYGYWDESTRNFHEALWNINKVLAELAGLREGERVLDAGCGVGGSAIWLAKEKKCQVVGISLNSNQVKKARRYASALALESRLVFEQKDYLNTDYPGNSFDVVWAIESVCYANNKTMFLKEASRLLKPKGILLVADFFKADQLKPDQASLVRRWANGWAVNDFSTAEAFNIALWENGFEQIQNLDVTDAIRPSAKRLYRYYLIGGLVARAYGLFHPTATLLGKANVHNAWLQYKTLKKGLWTYRIVKAIAP